MITLFQFTELANRVEAVIKEKMGETFPTSGLAIEDANKESDENRSKQVMQHGNDNNSVAAEEQNTSQSTDNAFLDPDEV